MNAINDIELWRCLDNAEQMKSDRELPLDVRVRAFGTYAVCLRAAHDRGYDYATLRDFATKASR
jgi:hypothetical protein